MFTASNGVKVIPDDYDGGVTVIIPKVGPAYFGPINITALREYFAQESIPAQERAGETEGEGK